MTEKVLLATKTEDIKKTLEEFCQLNDQYQLNDIDFNLISEEIIGDKRGSIRKAYEIEILPKENVINPLRGCAKIIYDNPDSPMVAYLQVFYKTFEDPGSFTIEQISASVKKLIAINRINFGIFSKKLNAISAEVFTRISKSHYKPFKIMLAAGRFPEDGKDSVINFYFERFTKSGKINDRGRVDYHKKGFASVVSKDSLLIEYIAPAKGKPGMDVHGTIIPQKEGRDINPFRFIAGEGTKLETDEKTKKIFSTRLGYVSIRGTTVEVKKELTVDRVDILKTGDIEISKAANLTLTIKKADVTKDAVSSGMTVEGHIIHIKGNVGRNANITGDSVVIEGLLHKDATVKAKTVAINICRGTVFAEDAVLNSAEYANIFCNEKVEAKKAISSSIAANNIYISEKMLNSNLVNGGDNIFINDIAGSDNKIAIDPLAIPKNKKRYEELISAKNEILKLISKNKISLVKIMKDAKRRNKETLKIMERISEIKKTGGTIPKTLLISLKQYKEILTDLEKKRADIHKITKQYTSIIEKIKKLRKLYRNGKITVSGNLPQGTILKFDDTLEKRVLSNISGVKISVKSEKEFEKIAFEKIGNQDNSETDSEKDSS